MRRLPLTRLQRKVIRTILVMVVVPMLAAGYLAAEWVSSNFEQRLQGWIEDSAHVGQTWLRAYQNDALMLGEVLADDPEFIAALDRGDMGAVHKPVPRIATELGITFMQVYDRERRLLHSSMPIRMRSLWEPGQTQAVMRVAGQDSSVLAAVGITPVPRQGAPRYYLVFGGLLDRDFIGELNQLTGLRTRLYYREGARYFDVFTRPGESIELRQLPKDALQRMQKARQPVYSVAAESGRYRGQYTPVVDSEGRVEAILFTGLERRGFEELVTNQALLFAIITALGAAIGILAGVFLSRIVVRPVELLRDAVMQLGAQNFDATVPITSDDEVGDLAKAFNAMAVRLREARDEDRRRFHTDKLAALGELSASLAHEIRNPVGVMTTSAALLEKPELGAAQRAELARMIREEGARVASLVQDFLQLSRHRRPTPASIDPLQPLERALAAVLAGVEGIAVQRSPGHGQARIRADAGLLQQAWGNILANAVQAMGPDGGELRIESRVVDGRVEVAVEDSGPGIPAEIVPRLFEPFFTTKEQGTGLGLSIANTLIEANGGRLEVQTPRRRGARFAMIFPAEEPSP